MQIGTDAFSLHRSYRNWIFCENVSLCMRTGILRIDGSLCTRTRIFHMGGSCMDVVLSCAVVWFLSGVF